MTDSISSTQDVIDSRDIIERIDELQAAWDEATESDHTDYALSGDDWKAGLSDDEADELVALLALVEDYADGIEDWQYGATLIHEDHFEDYAQELAEELDLIKPDAPWPTRHIDWEAAADELRIDYQEIDFNGETYLVR